MRARNINPQRHTGLPRYMRGEMGIVVKYYGNHDYPDIDVSLRCVREKVT